MTNPSFQTAITQYLLQAGKVLLKHFGTVTKINVKENLSSVVSVADVESEKVILDLIKKDFPEHNLISEETGYNFKGSQFTWIVDPLDGTSNFVAGLPWFGILIAVLKDFVPVAGGAYLPVDQKLYYAEQGKPALLNAMSIGVNNNTELKDVLVAYSLDYSADFNEILSETGLIAKLVQNVRNIRSTNCLLDFLFTSDGRLGAAINQHEKIWDISALWLILKQSGGMITDIKGKELDFTVSEKDFNKDFPVVASNGIIHLKLIDLIRGKKNK